MRMVLDHLKVVLMKNFANAMELRCQVSTNGMRVHVLAEDKAGFSNCCLSSLETALALSISLLSLKPLATKY